MPIEARSRRWLGTFGLVTVGAVLFLLFGFGSTPASGNLVPSPWDKLIHCGVFATLAVGLRALLPTLPWPVIFLLAGGVAVADELHQFLVPNRRPGWDDGLADLVGIAGGLLAWPWLEKRLPPWRPCGN